MAARLSVTTVWLLAALRYWVILLWEDCTRVGANAVVIKDYKRGYGVLVGVPATAKNESSKERLKFLGIDFDETLFD